MKKKSLFYQIFLSLGLASVTKVVSMTTRIIITRSLSVNAVSIYSLVNPLFVFFITLTSFSLPTTVSTLVAKYPNKSKKIFLSSLLISLSICILFIILITFFSNIIAINLLHNPKTLLNIKLLVLLVPLTCISSIIKGFFIGKENIILTSSSSLVEESSRLISTIVLIGLFLNFNDEIKSTFFALVMIIGEVVQTSYLLLSSGKHYIKKMAKIREIFEVDKNIIKKVFSLSTPLTLSRIITSFTYMIEPIIITNILLKLSLDIDEITLNYGILNSYVMPMLNLPNFFCITICNYLLVKLSSLISKNKIKDGEKLFYRILILTFMIGLFFSLIFLFFGDEILMLVYQVPFGGKEIKLLSLPFIIFYLETPINISMNALDLSSTAFKSSLISSSIRIILLIILSKYLGVFSVALAMLGSIYLDVIINYVHIHLFFKRNNKKITN